MDVEVTRDGSTLRAKVTGEVDSHNCGEFATAIRAGLEDDVRLVEVDLGGLSFIDSSGLSELVKLHNELADRDGLMIVRNPTQTVERVLQITGLAEPFGLT